MKSLRNSDSPGLWICRILLSSTLGDTQLPLSILCFFAIRIDFEIRIVLVTL